VFRRASEQAWEAILILIISLQGRDNNWLLTFITNLKVTPLAMKNLEGTLVTTIIRKEGTVTIITRYTVTTINSVTTISRKEHCYHHQQEGTLLPPSTEPLAVSSTHLASHPTSPDAENSHLLYLKTSELRSFVFSGFVLIITMICNRQSTQRGREKH